MILFAQSSFEAPSGLMTWMGCLAFLLVVLNQGWKFFGNITGRKQEIAPQPFVVEHAEKPVSEAQCAIHREDIIRRLNQQDQERAEMRTKMDDAEKTARVRSAGIYTKIEEVRKELSTNTDELRAEMNRNFQDTERTLGRIEGKLDKQ